jgi:hypothetical protein
MKHENTQNTYQNINAAKYAFFSHYVLEVLLFTLFLSFNQIIHSLSPILQELKLATSCLSFDRFILSKLC